jgi:hypothetical protein
MASVLGEVTVLVEGMVWEAGMPPTAVGLMDTSPLVSVSRRVLSRQGEAGCTTRGRCADAEADAEAEAGPCLSMSAVRWSTKADSYSALPEW